VDRRLAISDSVKIVFVMLEIGWVEREESSVASVAVAL
jgi:hypothetical protein